MSYVALIESRVDALALVQVGVRLTYVRATTGLPEQFLRDLWRDVHGKSPAPGGTYSEVDSGLRNIKQRREAAAFANLYFTAVEGKEIKSIQPRRFIQAWKAFRELLPDADMNPTLGWTIIRNLCAKLTRLETCNVCGTGFIRHAEQYGRSARCPFCADRSTRSGVINYGR